FSGADDPASQPNRTLTRLGDLRPDALARFISSKADSLAASRVTSSASKTTSPIHARIPSGRPTHVHQNAHWNISLGGKRLIRPDRRAARGGNTNRGEKCAPDFIEHHAARRTGGRQ